MKAAILTLRLRAEADVVLARQRARQLAALLGFDAMEQTRIATAVSEVARNAVRYAGEGRVAFDVEGEGRSVELVIRVQDTGPGIADLTRVLEGRYRSSTGMGLGIAGARRLVDRFEIDSAQGRGTTVVLGKVLPRQLLPSATPDLGRIAAELARSSVSDPVDEVQLQNQELLGALETLAMRQEQVAQLNRELEETNRGVVALYAELEERAESLRRADQLKSRFLSNMSHEFRTPLNSIRAITRLLLDRTDGELTPEQEKQVRFVRQSAEELTGMVDDLLDLAKVEAGRIEVRPVPFTAGDLLSALKGMFRPLAITEAVALVFEEPVGVPAFETDDAKVSQVLRNFISNALKYTERGEVRVSASLDPSGRAVVFSVADTGIGIAPEDQELIFEEFAQIAGPLQKRVKGTGLGLPLAKKLTELLGGRVAVRSTRGKGSTFSATIPLVYPGARRPAGTAEARAGDLGAHLPAAPGGPLVLVVDDDVASRYVARQYLESAGYAVTEAADGIEGLRQARESRPAAIVLDLGMPGMDGFDVLQLLKGDRQTRDVPVLVSTSALLAPDDLRRLAGQAEAVLSKGDASREVLVDAVGRAVANR